MSGAWGSLPVRPSPRLCLRDGRPECSSFDQTVQTRGGASREATRLEGSFHTVGVLEGQAGPLCLSPDYWRRSPGQVCGVGPGGRLLSPRGLWPVCGGAVEAGAVRRAEGVSLDGHGGARACHSIAAGGMVSEELPGKGATVTRVVTWGPRSFQPRLCQAEGLTSAHGGKGKCREPLKMHSRRREAGHEAGRAAGSRGPGLLGGSLLLRDTHGQVTGMGGGQHPSLCRVWPHPLHPPPPPHPPCTCQHIENVPEQHAPNREWQSPRGGHSKGRRSLRLTPVPVQFEFPQVICIINELKWRGFNH